MNFPQPILYFLVIFQVGIGALNRPNEFKDNPIVNSIELKHVDKRVMPNVLSEAGFQSKDN